MIDFYFISDFKILHFSFQFTQNVLIVEIILFMMRIGAAISKKTETLCYESLIRSSVSLVTNVFVGTGRETLADFFEIDFPTVLCKLAVTIFIMITNFLVYFDIHQIFLK